MPPRKKIEKRTGAEPRPAVQTEAAPAPSRGEQARADVRREAAIAALPDGYLSFLKDNLGVDLADRRQVSNSAFYDILQGKVTDPVRDPIDIVVTPLAYDYAKGENVRMPRIKMVAGLRVEFPKEDRKFVPLDADHRARVTTVPCLPLVEKAEGFEAAAEQAPASQPVAESQDGPRFTESQLMALEGIGIDRHRLFGGANAISRAEKADIAEGRTFMVNGSVKTDAGLLRVVGEAKLVTDSEGNARAMFETTYPEKRSESLVLDVLGARRQEILTKEGRATLELDFIRRDPTGRAMRDVNGIPYLNKAGENLMKYGMAMEPVVGYIKRNVKEDGKWTVKTEPARHYQVSVVAGNLHVTPMKEVKDLAPDGTAVTYKDRKGQMVEQTHPEIYNPMVKDGKVNLDGFGSKGAQSVDFASKKDEESYVRGGPAVVKGATFHDFSTKKDITYDAVVVADNRKGGFAHPFSPSVSKELMEGMKPEKAQRSRKKQDYSIKISM